MNSSIWHARGQGTIGGIIGEGYNTLASRVVLAGVLMVIFSSAFCV